MTYKILGIQWRNHVGFVAYETDEHLPEEDRSWCAVVGVVFGSESEYVDSQNIAAWGMKLSWQEAAPFFPELDINKYKYPPRK